MFDRGTILVFALALCLVAACATGAETPADDGSRESAWGPIAPESEDNTARQQDTRRPLWENTLYYPYQVVAWPARTVSGGVGSAITWASRPDVYRTARDVVTLSFLPIQGRVSASAGGGDGFGLGYSLTHDEFLGPDNRMKLALGRFTEGKSKATLGLLFGEDRVDSWSLGVGYRRKPNSRYHGLGYASREQDESYYNDETAWLGAAYRRDVGGSVDLELDVLYSTAATRGPVAHADQSLETVFSEPGGIPVGFGEQSDGATFGLGLRQDTTDENGRPERGGIRLVKFSAFNAGGGPDAPFWQTRAEVQQFLPLWHTKRTLAVRCLYSRLHGRDDAPLPFQRLLTNDDPDLLRGYHDQRFRDRGLVAGSVEYRFPAWNYKSVGGLGLDAYLFVDYGQVFAHRSQIALRNLAASRGGGFRFVAGGGFSGRLELGFSDEDLVIRFAAKQIFQFGEGGLFHGRNPIPGR